MKILFSGGGTLGPVTPLLAIKESIDSVYKDTEYIWVGTKNGPEKNLIQKHDIPFISIASGKLRRYVSVLNIFDIFKIFFGSIESLIILLREQPDMCISAGGFTSVPVHFVSWMLGIPTWIHQQDIRIGLANKIMTPFARIITVSMAELEEKFKKKKVFLLGNPVRKEILLGKKERAYKMFSLKKDLPVIFAMGGGTGSLRVNQLMIESIKHLEGKCQIIHLTGKSRPQKMVRKANTLYKYYHHYKFFTDEMKDAYAVADIVITRGGFGSLTEIAALGKKAIVMPMPGQQQKNVRFLEKKEAVILLDESSIDGNVLAKEVLLLLDDKERQKKLSINIQEALPVAHSEDIMVIVNRLVT
jgi:UDP-N-acetylglucosamine--N-acetylmuramyl-(pentapeptide) pyrophosphoryl-undecaprenol N-acetylglucosamine transferase